MDLRWIVRSIRCVYIEAWLLENAFCLRITYFSSNFTSCATSRASELFLGELFRLLQPYLGQNQLVEHWVLYHCCMIWDSRAPTNRCQEFRASLVHSPWCNFCLHCSLQIAQLKAFGRGWLHKLHPWTRCRCTAHNFFAFEESERRLFQTSYPQQ